MKAKWVSGALLSVAAMGALTTTAEAQSFRFDSGFGPSYGIGPNNSGYGPSYRSYQPSYRNYGSRSYRQYSGPRRYWSDNSYYGPNYGSNYYTVPQEQYYSERVVPSERYAHSYYYTPTENRARFRVTLPRADARLFIQGQEIKGRGDERVFVSPRLEPGREYTYKVRATWMEDGRERNAEKSVDFTAGGNIVLRVHDEAPQER